MQITIGTFKLAALAAILGAGVFIAVGCSSNSVGSINSGPTANPNSDQTVSQISAGVGGNVVLPAVNGFSGVINTTATSGGGASATIEDQTNAVLPPPAYTGAILYISITVSNAVTFSGTPSLGFVINVPPGTPTGQYYLAFYDPTQASPAWVTASVGPVTLGGVNTITLNTNATITLKAGTTYWWALYP